jgi:Calx-beta domain-containing protein
VVDGVGFSCRRLRAGVLLVAVTAATLGLHPGAAPAATRSMSRTHAMRRGVSNLAPHSASLSIPHPNWYGGDVIAHPKIVEVVYGSGTFQSQVTSNTAPNFPSFYAGITNSKYFDWMSEYSAGGTVIGRGSYVGRYTITPAAGNNGTTACTVFGSPTTCIDDAADIQPELLAQINAHNLPQPDPDTIYVMHFPDDKILQFIDDSGAQNSVQHFCAYHGTEAFDVTTNIRYAVIPDNSSASDCGDTPGFGNMTSVVSHEVTEAVTDPDIGLATSLGPPLAWYDSDYGEVSDICVGFQDGITGGDGRTYVVQQNWSNQAEDCITSGTARTISVGDASIMEGDAGARSLRFSVTLSAPSNEEVDVDYQLQGVSATGGSQAAGVDFNNASGTLHQLRFLPSDSTGVTPVRLDVTVPIYGDTADEPDESFTITLSDASAGYGIADAEGTGKVVDDDPKIDTTTIGVGGGKIHRGLKGNRRIFLPITISHSISKSVTVKWVLHSGTAKAGSDYSTPTSGTATIAAHSMGTTVQVLVYAKNVTSDKSFTIAIGPSSTPLPAHTKFSKTSATTTILRG